MARRCKKTKIVDGEIQFSWLDYDQKKAELTEEEQELRSENLEARQHMNPRGVQNLMSAVCLQAVEDYKRYRQALAYYADDVQNMKSGRKLVPNDRREKIISLQAEIRECEEFFHSEIFGECSGIWNGDKVIDAINQVPRSYLTTI